MPIVSPRLVILLGSVTPPGRLPRALAEAGSRARQRHPDADIIILDLGTLEIAFADGRPPADLGGDTAAVVEAIGAADAVLRATPTYPGSLTGPLKNVPAPPPVAPLRDKPVGIAAM